jgi:hypothetical protein
MVPQIRPLLRDKASPASGSNGIHRQLGGYLLCVKQAPSSRHARLSDDFPDNVDCRMLHHKPLKYSGPRARAALALFLTEHQPPVLAVIAQD